MHEEFLRTCFKLAKLGEATTFPNPIVGCVIVHNGKIISEGFHKKYGEYHAELNCINSALERYSIIALEQLFNYSTIYVSLEPCSHHGKTPPCTDLIIKHKFKTLVYASKDPNPLVAGKGIERIEAAGIEVIGPRDLDPMIVSEAQALNKAFYKIVSGGKYFVTCKVALNKDGNMFTQPGIWQTGEEARLAVHRMRACHQLLVTSIRTVLADNPEYTVRFNPEELGLTEIKNPDILILKSSTDFSPEQRQSLRIFDPKYKRKIYEASIGINKDYSDLKSCLEAMSTQGYQKIMVEAGPTLSKAFLDDGLVDDYKEFKN